LFRAGENASMIPKIYTPEVVLRSAAYMAYANSSEGRNVYIRPRGEHDMTLLDDLKPATIQQMKREGFAPALVVETSPGNFQAWLKHGQQLPQDLSTHAAKLLAVKFDADRGSADWRHFGRLAGYTNRKPQYENDGLFPYVKLREASGSVYKQAGAFIAEAGEQWKRELERREAYRVRAADTARPYKTIEQFRNNPAYAGDMHRADLAYAVRATYDGVSRAEIARAIGTRDLAHKGTPLRQEGYIERTLEKAAEIVRGKGRGISRW
jgi:hypothetical protein